ncbi:MAG: flagellar basal body-associated FliL family protein [Dethiobacter sp.]|jgi:flagellar basal body-associated protein FliL|nr:flagellar basal body-associated FliL family protein [Dethiobacter sp.]
MAEQARKETDIKEGGGKQSTKKKPRYLYALAFVLLLLALSAGLYFTGLLSRFLPGQEQEVSPDAPPRYSLPLSEFQVNLADAGARRFLRMTIYLAYDESALAEEIAAREPEMRSEIIAVLRDKTVADLEGPEGMAALQEAILAQLNQMLQEGQVSSIYFTELLIQ